MGCVHPSVLFHMVHLVIIIIIVIYFQYMLGVITPLALWEN